MGENPFQETIDDLEMPEFDEPAPRLPIAPYISSTDVSQSTPQMSKSSASPKPLTGDKRAKLEALRQREAELLEKKKKIDQQTSELTPTPNFPSFFPLLRYNPEEDLPQASRQCIKYSLYMLIFLTAASIFNVFAVLSVKGPKNYQKTRSFIFGCIQGFAAVYLGTTFCYNLLYSSCKKRNIPFKWTLYQFLMVAWCIYITLGFPTSGSVGIATFLDILANNAPVFSIVTALLNTLLAGGATAFSIFTLSAAQAYQKVSGNEDPLIEGQQQ
jgi:hypothetical protein